MTEFEYNKSPNPTHTQLLNLNPSKLLDTYDKYMYLKLYIDDLNDLKNTYLYIYTIRVLHIFIRNNIKID